MPLTFIRSFLLVFGILTALTATVLDGVMMRHVLQPLIRHIESRSGQTNLRFPAPMQFMLTHAWARRLYNLLLATSVLSIWWYLRRPAGQNVLTGMR
jgi:hypothetical protein